MVCISNPGREGFNCWDEKTEKEEFIFYKDSDKFVAMPPDDAHTFFDFCAQKQPGDL